MPRRISLRATSAALAVLAVAAPAAMAKKPVVATSELRASSSPCNDLVVTQALLPFGDTNWYFLAPQGSFETGADGWTVSSGRTVADDSGFADGPKPGRYSLELAPGATATSPPLCANSTTPSFRFFARTVTGDASSYTVEVTYVTTAGDKVRASGMASVGSAWSLTPEFRVLTNKIAEDASGWGSIQVSVTAANDSALRIDDLYVDPRMR